MAAVPAVPGAINVPVLEGDEIVEIHPYGQRRAQTTTQAIADLGVSGAITISTFTAFVLTLPTTPTDGGPWLNGNVISFGTVTP